MAHQSLYRRYRPRRFREVRGQDHVVRALRNAVATDTVGHAYLFSGPRGTGKTSTARILAKALNCEDLHDGEPCCECGPCVEMEAGRSFDLFELDAASNNGVDAIRDLVERASVGSPGRTKVYILDEVHMLSTAASNALLKTLEEPPGHVCFVLATTDSQKVLPTIRSRTQHYEFQLLSAQELTDYVRWIAQDAQLDVDEASVAHVVRDGRGSARDTLSALDQVVAAGGVITRALPVDRLLQAVADADSGAAVLAVSDALALGNDPRVLADGLLSELRDAFLLSLGVEVAHLVDSDAARLGGWAQTLGSPTLTRATEAVGSALVDMRNAADPRVPLDVALVRLCVARSEPSTGADQGGDRAALADLVRRIEALEQALGNGPPVPDAVPSVPTRGSGSVGIGVEADRDGQDGGGPAAARAALGAVRAAKARGEARAPAQPEQPSGGGRPPAPRAPTTARPAQERSQPPPTVGASSVQRPRAGEPPPTATEPDGETSADVGDVLSQPPALSSPTGARDLDELRTAFGDVVLPNLKGVAKAVYGGGRFVSVTPRGAVFEVDNAPTRERAEKYRVEVEAALSAHFATPVTLVLSNAMDPVDAGPQPAPPRETGSTGQPQAEHRPGDTVDDATAVSADTTTTDTTTTDTTTTDTTTTATTADDDTDDELAIIDVHELEDADIAATGVEKLTQAFPGAVLVDGPDGSN